MKFKRQVLHHCLEQAKEMLNVAKEKLNNQEYKEARKIAQDAGVFAMRAKRGKSFEKIEEDENEECTIDEECKIGEVCVEGECENVKESECTTDADCKEYENCVEDKCKDFKKLKTKKNK